MPEEQKQEIKAPEQTGYYKDTRGKLVDFFIGFIGCPALASLAMLAGGMYNNMAQGIGAVISVALTISFVFFSIKKGRKFIAIGIASLYILPLIVVGSCLLVMSVK